jgi:hypothetical protein
MISDPLPKNLSEVNGQVATTYLWYSFEAPLHLVSVDLHSPERDCNEGSMMEKNTPRVFRIKEFDLETS